LEACHGGEYSSNSQGGVGRIENISDDVIEIQYPVACKHILSIDIQDYSGGKIPSSAFMIFNFDNTKMNLYRPKTEFLVPKDIFFYRIISVA
jgi:hypothetical protein